MYTTDAAYQSMISADVSSVSLMLASLLEAAAERCGDGHARKTSPPTLIRGAALCTVVADATDGWRAGARRCGWKHVPCPRRSSIERDRADITLTSLVSLHQIRSNYIQFEDASRVL